MSNLTYSNVHNKLCQFIALFPESSADMLFAYAKHTFSKTKKSCHIIFLRSCIRSKVIPKGMTLSHTPSDHSNTPLKFSTDRILKRASISLMKAHISTSHREILSLNRTIYFLKNNISTHFSQEEATRIKHFVHDLNKLVYDLSKSTKDSKLSSLSVSNNSPNPSIDGQTEEG